MRTLKPRIVITIDQGLVANIYAEGFDASQIDVIKIDYDTEGAVAEDGVVTCDGVECFFDVLGFDEPEDEFMTAVGHAYDRWSHTEG